MNIKALMGSVLIAHLHWLVQPISTSYQSKVINKRSSGTYANTYDVSFKEIKKLYDFINSVDKTYFVYWIAKDYTINPSSVPSDFWGSNNRAPLIFNKSTVELCDSLASVYGFSWADDEDIIFDKIKNTSVINVPMKITHGARGLYDVLSFSASLNKK